MNELQQTELDAREAARFSSLLEWQRTHRYEHMEEVEAAYFDAFDAGVQYAKSFHQPKPMDAVLWCPRCFEQHIDKDKPEVCESCGFEEDAHHDVDASCSVFEPWLNPPHKSHRCEFCNHVWRPAEGPTNGVQSLQKQGERDGSAKPVAFANGKDFEDAVQVATGHQPKWVRIETEADLPKESGHYIWQTKDGAVGCGAFHPAVHVDEMLKTHVAWMPLPGPQGEQKQK